MQPDGLGTERLRALDKAHDAPSKCLFVDRSLTQHLSTLDRSLTASGIGRVLPKTDNSGSKNCGVWG